MIRVRFVCLALVLACLLGAGGSVLAAEVDCDATYCFTSQEFSLSQEEPIVGICITELPRQMGVLMLGNRILQRGDILTAEQVNQMTFSPARTDQDAQAVMSYLPIYENRVAPCAAMSINIRGKENLAPNVKDSTLETYKNIPNEGMLDAKDPEGEALIYSVIRQPKRGEVAITPEGSFTYTPKKNKVGVDSFTYTATDASGNVSREATVTIQILKPTDVRQYTDTVGMDCRFEAEWLRNTGLFVGESVSGQSCFRPEKEVTGGEFLAMMVKLLEIPTQQEVLSSVPEEAPEWMKPYLAAALRSGLTDRLPDFNADAPITGAEAAVMLQNALDLALTQEVLELEQEEEQIPAWAEMSVTVMQENGVPLSGIQTLTRADAARILYQANQLALDAPGMAVLRVQA